MKRLLGIIGVLAIVSLAAAQAPLDEVSSSFDITVEGTTAIDADWTSLGDFTISYDLEDPGLVTVDGTSSFLLRYITNETGPVAVITQDDCKLVPGTPDTVSCDDPKVATAGQFESRYITVAAGELDGGALQPIDEFEDALTLSLEPAAAGCSVWVRANHFKVPAGFDAYVVTDSEGDPMRDIEAEDFSAIQKRRARAQLGEARAVEIAFDGVEKDLVGHHGQESLTGIRGVVCGPEADQGLTVNVAPNINHSRILPEGTKTATIVITIREYSSDS